MPKPKIKINKTIGSKFTGKKPRALHGGATKKQRLEYLRIKAALHPRKGGIPDLTQKPIKRKPTGISKRTTTQLNVAAKKARLARPKQETLEKLFEQGIKKSQRGLYSRGGVLFV